ncbi:Na+/H+ antiporter [Roseomonas elaeocarpi]|uniref:Na+/H+ antiporter n=1 Tax=Roseomonas elaeocarpi TaxID=907779 RepID=A0ABV6JQQ3_9PROT
MSLAETLLILAVICVTLSLLAQKLNAPYAVMLVLGGMAVAFVPQIPDFRLDPEFALAFFLPPLLQAGAWRTDWAEFRRRLDAILLLAIGAVLFTAACIALVAKWLLPGLPWAAAVALGAIVAPPDAVAAAAVLKRLRMPRGIVSVLEGESLINDAASLVLYRLAVGALVAGQFSVAQAGLSFLGTGFGGLLIGYALGRAALWAMPRLEDSTLQIALSFLLAFAAYLLAESFHASGVIAVVTGGFVLSRGQRRVISADARQQSLAVWDFTEFLLNTLVFILVGMQLATITARLSGHGLVELGLMALALSAVLVLSRSAWVYAVSWLPERLLRPAEQRTPASHYAVVSWAGMRGVVSLAAALALPLETPDRDLLVFLTFCAIFVTLVLQGTTLEWVIRWLGVEEPLRKGMTAEEADARRLIARAALAELEGHADSPIDGAVAGDLIPEFRNISRVFDAVAKGRSRAELRARLQLRLAALRAGQKRLLEQHEGVGLSEELLASLTSEMDHEEIRLLALLRATG